MSRHNIPSVRIEFEEHEVDQIARDVAAILKSGQLTLGPYTERFEEEFASLVQRKYAIAVSSGTSALEICLRILGVEGSEVMLPTNTNYGTAAAVMQANGILHLVDSDPKSFSIDLAALASSLTPRTRGVICVHIGGVIAENVHHLKSLCKDHGLFLIEDAAHAHGSSLGGRMAGSLGDAAAFSFFPTKVMTTGEGGIVVTDDEQTARLARVYRDQGKEHRNRNLHSYPGSSWRMSEFQAALGLQQLRSLKRTVRRRRRIASVYDQALRSTKKVRPLFLSSNQRSNYYKYICLLQDGVDRTNLRHLLQERYSVALSGEVYAVPCHRQPVFQGRFEGGPFPNADEICGRHVCLPLYPGMSKVEADYVVESLVGALKPYEAVE